MKPVFYILSCIGCLLLISSSNIHAQVITGSIDNSLGIYGDLSAPLRVTEHPNGAVYITDGVDRSVSKYDPSGNFIETITAVPFPVSVAVNSEGQLFIGDGETGNIYRYGEDGTVLVFYEGTMYPSSMVFSPDNTLYVADSRLQEVIALDLSGNVVGTIGSGIVDFPTGLAFDASNQRILVGEHGGKGTGFKPLVKVWMFDLQGNLVKSFGSHGSGDGQFYRVQGLTVGKCGYIYVVDPYQARISVFDDNGTFITKFGDFGLQAGELNVPMDIVFDSQERLLVTSMNNGSVEVFSFTDTLPTTNMKTSYDMICSGESADIEIAFTGTAPWSFSYTIDGLNPTTVNTSENPHILSVADSGHYEIIALSDANYSGTCFTGSADVVVSNTPPTAQMEGDANICEGETTAITVDFTGSAPWDFTYTVDGLNPVSQTTTNNPHIIEVSETGLYELTGLIGGGCEGTSLTGSASILVKQLPTATMTDGNRQIYINPGDSAELSVELTGTSPWTITYAVDDLNPVSIYDIKEGEYSLLSSQEGTYEVKEVVDSRCASTASRGYPEVVMNSTPEAPTSRIEEGDLFFCPGEYVPIQVHFTGVAPWTFTYTIDSLATTIHNNNANPYIINAIHEGTYEVTALADKYSTGSEFSGKAMAYYNALPVSNFSYVAENLEVSVFSISENSEFYFWDFGDGSISTEENPVHIYNAPGDYRVSLTVASEQCTGSTISRTVSILSSSVIGPMAENSHRIYPNPSEGMVVIELGNPDIETHLEVISLNGHKILSDILPRGIRAKEINLGYLEAGLYIVKISSKDLIKVEKLVIINR